MLASNILPANTMALAALLLISSLSLPSTVEARPGLTRHHKRLIIDRAAGVLARRGKTLCPQKRGETGDLFKPVLNSGDGAIEIVNAAADDDSQNLFTPISPTTANSGRTPLTVLPINSASQSTQNPAGGSLFTPNAAPSSPASTPSSTSVTPASSPLKTPAAAAQTPSSDSSSSSFSSSGPGLFGFSTQQCGASGATSKVSKLAGPNGSMDFLNCGLYSGGGWTPPSINIGQIAAVSLDEAILDPNSPFTPCKPYVGLFDKYAAETGLPPILIAAIAMQESTCNPTVMGDDNGAYGLMQITQDKCTSGIDCSDPDYNVKTGTYYLKSRLDANNGNILLALGEYNGWYQSLTVAKATAIKSSCCQCQNNLNYLHQMLNGWLQNQIGYNLGDFDMGC